MRKVILKKDGIGEFLFDGVSSVLSGLDFGYPEIYRKKVEKNDVFGVEISDTYVGIGETTIKGYILNKSVPISKSHRLLSQIVGVGDTFILQIGEYTREMSANSLSFVPDAGFTSGFAEKFVIKAVAVSGLFKSEAKTVYATPNVSGNLILPVTFGRKFGEVSSHGKVTVNNCGDSEVGIVMNIKFPAQSSGFVLSSSRESGNFAITGNIPSGKEVKVDTRTGKKGIWDSNGTSLIGSIDTRCKFFTLKPGETVFSFRNISDKPPILSVTFEEGLLTVPVWEENS